MNLEMESQNFDMATKMSYNTALSEIVEDSPYMAHLKDAQTGK